MEKGQIIRRMLNNGTPVGAYMRIMSVKNTHVIAQNLSNLEQVILLKKHIYEVKLSKIILSEKTWERINTDRQHSIIHDVCPTWTIMYDKEPDVVQLRAFGYQQKVTLFTVDQIRDVWYNRERQIRLDLGERIL